MVSPSPNDTAGFAPLAPPTVWQGWDAFVHRAPAPARNAADPAWSQTEREDYHSELAVMRTRPWTVSSPQCGGCCWSTAASRPAPAAV